MLVDAGANTTSVEALKRDPLDHLRHVLRLEESTEEADGAQLNWLKAIRRLLMSVEAIHAVSWLWPSDNISIADNDVHNARGAEGTWTVGTPLTLVLPILRRRARQRGVILAPLFRLVICM